MGKSTKSNAFASNGNVKGRQVKPTEVPVKPVSTAHAKPGSKAEKSILPVEVTPSTPEKVTAAVARNTKGNEKVRVEKPEDIKANAKLLEETE